MLTAIIRPPSAAISRCALTFQKRTPLDLERALQQHRVYGDRLVELGVRLIELPAEPQLPDAAFVEDGIVVFDELAVIARSGCETRRAETTSLADVVRPYRTLCSIQTPATLDGGDVLQIGRAVYLGVSSRSNAAALGQLEALLRPHGYRVEPITVRGCLHLKTGCTYLGRKTLLVNPAWLDPAAWPAYHLVDVHPDEPDAANTLRLGDTVLMAASCPRTAARVRSRGWRVSTIDISELQKAEAGLTCLSVVFDDVARQSDPEPRSRARSS